MRIVKSSLIALALLGMVGCSGDEETTQEAVGGETASNATANPDGTTTTTNPDGTVTVTNPDGTTQTVAADAVGNTGNSSGASGFGGIAAQAAEAAQEQANQATASNWNTLYVTGTELLRVRNAPSIEAPVVRSIRSGTSVANLGRVRTWVKVGANEWASAKHLQNSNGQLALDHFRQQDSRAQYNFHRGPMRVTGTASLRVRTAPNNQATVSRTIRAGQTVTPTRALPGGWYQIGNGEFVHKSYLTPTSAAH